MLSMQKFLLSCASIIPDTFAPLQIWKCLSDLSPVHFPFPTFPSLATPSVLKCRASWVFTDRLWRQRKDTCTPYQCIVQLINCLIFSARTKTKEISLPFLLPRPTTIDFFLQNQHQNQRDQHAFLSKVPQDALHFATNFKPSNALNSRMEGVLATLALS